MARFGIHGANMLGVPVTTLRAIARRYRPDHSLALALWDTGVHEIRILASMLDEPAEVTPSQMDSWVTGFDSWDLCDQTCLNLFHRTPHVVARSHEWSRREPEFERRAGFVLMAVAAVHRHDLDDAVFVDFLPALVAGMSDDRNVVRKAVSWSFRQIGKRDAALGHTVLATVEPFLDSTDRTRRRVARDVTRELRTRLGAGADRPPG
jgi:3-methyladenine DNA glycosylase AlkD